MIVGPDVIAVDTVSKLIVAMQRFSIVGLISNLSYNATQRIEMFEELDILLKL